MLTHLPATLNQVVNMSGLKAYKATPLIWSYLTIVCYYMGRVAVVHSMTRMCLEVKSMCGRCKWRPDFVLTYPYTCTVTFNILERKKNTNNSKILFFCIQPVISFFIVIVGLYKHRYTCFTPIIILNSFGLWPTKLCQDVGNMREGEVQTWAFFFNTGMVCVR